MRAQLLADGAVAVLCAGMGAHAASPAVLLEGCVALASLARDDEAVKKEVNDAGGLQLVIGALRAYKDNSELQRWGYKALRSLATEDALGTATRRGGKGKLYSQASKPANGAG